MDRYLYLRPIRYCLMNGDDQMGYLRARAQKAIPTRDRRRPAGTARGSRSGCRVGLGCDQSSIPVARHREAPCRTAFAPSRPGRVERPGHSARARAISTRLTRSVVDRERDLCRHKPLSGHGLHATTTEVHSNMPMICTYATRIAMAFGHRSHILAWVRRAAVAEVNR